MGIFKNLLKDFDYDEDFDYEDDYDNTWFHQRFCEETYKNTLKKNVQEKLFTDKKLTFEEYTTLLEIIVDKFRDSFNCNNGKFDIIFRERTFKEKLKINDEKDEEK